MTVVLASAHLIGKLIAAEDVEMQMLYALASVGAAVGDHSVTARQPLGSGDLGNNLENFSHNGTVLRGNTVNGRNMRLGYNQNVNGSLRVYIPESQNIHVLVNLSGRNIAVSDSAKKTIHNIINPFNIFNTQPKQEKSPGTLGIIALYFKLVNNISEFLAILYNNYFANQKVRFST